MSMREFRLSKQQIKMLLETAITDAGPGLILHDFQVLLDYVAEMTPELSKTRLLRLRDLHAVNAGLARTIEHGLSRPQQKSLPHINGLYLLLRASGLTMVEESQGRPVLVVDPVALESWNRLIASERYFALLEAWLLHGDLSIIGEHQGRFFFQNPLVSWLGVFEQLTTQRWYVDDWVERVRYEPGLANLALLELFGLVTLVDAPAEPGKGWRIGDVQATDWGQALLTLVAPRVLNDPELMVLLDTPHAIPAGALQPIIQPYRPEWRQVLTIVEPVVQDGVLVVRVALDANLWRLIALPTGESLDTLSDAILDAYRFDHDHLYRFTYATRFGVRAGVNHPYMDEGPYTDEVCLCDLPIRPGFALDYNYDFGDNWHFGVVVERIDPPDPKLQGYRILQRKGKSPEQYPTWE